MKGLNNLNNIYSGQKGDHGKLQWIGEVIIWYEINDYFTELFS